MCPHAAPRTLSGLSKDKVILAQLEAELAGEAEVEPSWELPAALQEYRWAPRAKLARALARSACVPQRLCGAPQRSSHT
jgi:hypothetical protein